MSGVEAAPKMSVTSSRPAKPAGGDVGAAVEMKQEDLQHSHMRMRERLHEEDKHEEDKHEEEKHDKFN